MITILLKLGTLAAQISDFSKEIGELAFNISVIPSDVTNSQPMLFQLQTMAA
jgi:hypothetical protein